jgi:hypothetical protein
MAMIDELSNLLPLFSHDFRNQSFILWRPRKRANQNCVCEHLLPRFRFMLHFVLPQAVFQLVRDVPETSLNDDLYLISKAFHDARITVGHQEKLLEENKIPHNGLEQLVPVAVIFADRQTGNPNSASDLFLNKYLEFSASFFDPLNRDACAIGLSCSLLIRIKPEFHRVSLPLNTTPDRHPAWLSAEHPDDFFGNSKRRKGPQKSQLLSGIRRCHNSGIYAKQLTRNKHLLSARFAFNLLLLDLQQFVYCTQRCMLAMSSFPRKVAVVTASTAAERFLLRKHIFIREPSQDTLKEIGKDHRKQLAERMNYRLVLAVRQIQGILTAEVYLHKSKSSFLFSCGE